MLITSTQNSLVKKAVSLRESKARKASGLTLIDGVRELKRAWDSRVALDQVFYCPKLFAAHGSEELLSQLNAAGVETVEVNEMVFAKMTFGERQEGLLGLAVIPQRKLSDIHLSKKPLVVIVESLEKPGNLGAIARTCDAVGADVLIVCDPKTDIYNPNVIRASTGIIFSLAVVSATKEDVLAFLKAKKIKACATIVDTKQLYTQADFSGAVAVVLGTEDKGLSDFWTRAADIKIKIPMHGAADSLNVSTSAAIVLYEVLRQRK